MKTLIASLILILTLTLPVFSQETLIIEDFEMEGDYCASRGRWKAWGIGPASSGRGTIMPGIRDYYYTRVLKLSYGITPSGSASCGVSIDFDKTDIKEFKYLNLTVMGDAHSGFPENLEITLGKGSVTASETLRGINAKWQVFSIPLNGIKDRLGYFNKVNNLKISVNKDSRGDHKGVVFIDDVFFTNEENKKALAIYHVQKGNNYAEGLMHEKAVKEYEKALAVEPLNIFALVNIGVVYTREKLYREAAVKFEKAIEINPECAPAHLDLGMIYDKRLFKPRKAREHYRKFLEYDVSLDFGRREKVKRWIESIEH